MTKGNINVSVENIFPLIKKFLYSDHEIFLRELISNASDAADKLRFEALSDPALFENDSILKIHVSFDEKARTITISDNGIGIAQQHCGKIFSIFQRLHSRKEYEGSGIGLSNCKKIVEIHKGKIWVQSALGTGSNFHFTIKTI